MVSNHSLKIQKGKMQWPVLFVLLVHEATSTFFHEPSSIELEPRVRKAGAAFGFSLAYQAGNTPKLLIGSPLYDETGRVFQCPLDFIKNAIVKHTPKVECDPLNINLNAMGVNYTREFSINQKFYLGASIAATNNYFLTCAPLRTAFLVNSRQYGFGAYGICFIYDETGKATPWTGPGREEYLRNKLRQGRKEEDIKWNDEIYGGHGWTTLVDEVHDRIIVAKTFVKCDAYVGKISEPNGSYRSLVKEGILNETSVSKFASYAHAMTIGNYFDPVKENTLYAISMMFETTEGGFQLLDSRSLKVASEWRHSAVGSMFGAALASADVTGDARADLLVGAPAHAEDDACWDRGAMHIFAAKPDEKKMDLKLTIRGTRDGARFATSLAAYDVNGDTYPEIIVGAPFGATEESVLYVLCGHEVSEILTQKGNSKKRVDISIPVSDLRRTQKVKRAYKNFGFSLLPIVDLDDNGSGELLVGAPDESKVTLYRGIPSITVEVTSRISNRPAGAEFEYVFLSCVSVRRPQKPKIITTKLSVNNVLHGYDAVFKSGEANYLVNLSDKGKQLDKDLEEYCQELIIKSTTACTVTTNISLAEDINKIKEFSNTWVTLSYQSKTEKSMLLTCSCTKIEDCKPELSVQLNWSGNQTGYVVGSSRVENVSIVVHNSGTRACAACVRVRVRGAVVDQLRCDYRKSGDYKCYLPSPFKQNADETIDLKLLMDVSNQDKSLDVVVKLKKNCEESEEVNQLLTIPYVFREDLVSVQGSGFNYSMSDIELRNENHETLTEEQIYTIVTTESVTWKNVRATITLKKEPYIQALNVSVTSTKPVQICDTINDTDSFSAICKLTLLANSTVEITVFATVIKKEITNYMKDWQITIPSELELELSSDMIKHHTVTTVIMLQKQTLGQNKTLIIIIAVVLGLLLLALLSFILYKVGFFKRKKKEELKDLKQEFRRRSTRRDREGSQRSHSQNADSHCDMEDLVIVEESPFDDPSPAEQFNSCAPAQDTKLQKRLHCKKIISTLKSL